jgi:hypothetical protein
LYDRIDRTGCADAQRKRQHHNDADTRRAAELPEGEAKVLRTLGKPARQRQMPHTPLGASASESQLFIRIAKASRRLRLGVGLAHSKRAKLGNTHLEMKSQLVVHFA